MARGVLNRLRALFGSDEDADGGDEGGSRFVPSVLDASVRYAHGESNTGEYEIAKIDEEARRRDEQKRRK